MNDYVATKCQLRGIELFLKGIDTIEFTSNGIGYMKI